MNLYIIIPVAIFAISFILTANWLLSLRRVVETNEVHIVQSSKSTTSYGRGQSAGNTYYHLPTWIPFYGVQVIKLPLAVFEIMLKDYDAYDQDKVPFNVDISAFLRVTDPNLAAQSIMDIESFKTQMKSIVQGSVRAVLGKYTINSILVDRKELAIEFTNEVKSHLTQWGVETAKNIEFMDIRDSVNSNVIENIRAEKVSEISKASRVKVAENEKLARTAEIESQREIDLKAEEAKAQVGKRQAEVTQQVGIATEISNQLVADEAKITAEKTIQVQTVQQVGAANISKETQIIRAEESKRVQILNAEAAKEVTERTSEAEKQKQVLLSQGQLTAKENEAKGIEATGTATAKAIEAKGLAEIAPQVELAQKIGENQAYQDFLIRKDQVQVAKDIGIAQAEALGKADLKIISNVGDVQSGVTSLSEVFSVSGGSKVGGMLESFVNTPTGAAIVNKLLGGSDLSSVGAAVSKATNTKPKSKE